MDCRSGCGACCIAPSITSPIPGMPEGKPAGVACVNLDRDTWRCRIWGTDEYPSVCHRFKPCESTCGETREQALELINQLELLTAGQPGLSADP